MQIGGRINLGEEEAFALFGGGDCEVEPAIESFGVRRLADGALENDGADTLDAEFGEFFDEPVEAVAFGDADGDNDTAGFWRGDSTKVFDIERDDVFSDSRDNSSRQSAIAVEKLDFVA